MLVCGAVSVGWAEPRGPLDDWSGEAGGAEGSGRLGRLTTLVPSSWDRGRTDGDEGQRRLDRNLGKDVRCKPVLLSSCEERDAKGASTFTLFLLDIP